MIQLNAIKLFSLCTFGVFILFVLGCDREDPSKISQDREALKQEVIKNFAKNNKAFIYLINTAKSQNIYYSKLVMGHAYVDYYDSVARQKLLGKPIESRRFVDNKISSSIAKNLLGINCNELLVLHNYDRINGTYINSTDIRYTRRVAGITFYYRVFSKKIDSLPEDFVSHLSGAAYGRLNDSTIWYFK